MLDGQIHAFFCSFGDDNDFFTHFDENL